MENYNDFSDCEPLTLSDNDIIILQMLHVLSLNDGAEHAAVTTDGTSIREFTSGLPDRVRIPSEIGYSGDVRIFHSHTIETPLSPNDLMFLVTPCINEVCVITKERSIFRVLVNGGIKPDLDEYTEKTDGLDAEVNFDIMEHPCFWSWDMAMRNYMATKEQMFRTVRLFKWRLEGGRI